MEYSLLGTTGLRVSRFCFGSLTLGPLCADLSLTDGACLLRMALDAGVTFIDTAEQYRTYPYIRAALDAFPQQNAVVISTKTFAETDVEASWAMEDARLALRRNSLDIMLLHEVRDEADFHARAGAWQALRDAKANGVIRAIGISTHSAQTAAFAAGIEEIDVLHPMFNRAGIGILDGGMPEMLAAIRAAKRSGKGVFTMKSIGGGALMQEAKSALSWAWSHGEIDSFAIGCKDRAELLTDLGWMAGEDPPEAQQVLLLDRNIAFDKEPRCHGCGRCVARCASGAMTLNAEGEAVWDKERCVFCGYCIAACPWFCLSFC